MFKIFQVHISGGSYDEYYDYIDSSYLDKSKAEMRVKELQDRLDKMCEQARICDNCEQCEQCEEDCYTAGGRDDDWCKNFEDYPQEYYEHEQYTIKEIEVIE